MHLAHTAAELTCAPNLMLTMTSQYCWSPYHNHKLKHYYHREYTDNTDYKRIPISLMAFYGCHMVCHDVHATCFVASQIWCVVTQSTCGCVRS
jgi:hypothetical protein